MNAWKNIRLELDRTTDFPAGSVGRAYLVRLPLDEGDAVDEAEVATRPYRATIRRHWSNEPDEAGVLVRASEGWAMRCRGRSDRVLKFDGTLRPGQRVLVAGPDGATLPFRVASVR